MEILGSSVLVHVFVTDYLLWWLQLYSGIRFYHIGSAYIHSNPFFYFLIYISGTIWLLNAALWKVVDHKTYSKHVALGSSSP